MDLRTAVGRRKHELILELRRFSRLLSSHHGHVWKLGTRWDAAKAAANCHGLWLSCSGHGARAGSGSQRLLVVRIQHLHEVRFALQTAYSEFEKKHGFKSKAVKGTPVMYRCTASRGGQRPQAVAKGWRSEMPPRTKPQIFLALLLLQKKLKSKERMYCTNSKKKLTKRPTKK